MNSVLKVVKTLRNNWKKTVVALIATNYGYNYMTEYLETEELMRRYCNIAAQYGRQTLAPSENPQQITIILNPNANKRKAAKDFEKYCAPILNLAGICVDVIHTENEGHARELVETLSENDAVIVAGGDGTLSEVITGLFRKIETEFTSLPIGILPLGKTNTIGKKLFPGGTHLEKVKSLADASLAIIQNQTKTLDVLKIVALNEEISKPIYAVAGIEWGAYRDAESKKETYWYYGPLRKYVTYLFNGMRNSLSWKCEATLSYTNPCSGCTNCKHLPQKRWYQRYLTSRTNSVDNSQETTNQCKEIHEKTVSTADFSLWTSNVLDNENGPPKLQIRLGPNEVNYLDFVSQGWKYEQGENRKISQVIEAKEVEINPVVNSDKEVWFSIDKEDFEVKPIKISLLPNALNFFCKNSNV